MFFFIIMLICSVSLFAPVAGVYMGKVKEKDGTVLSVHLPEEGMKAPETAEIAETYRKHMKNALWIMGIAGVIVTALAATPIYTSIFIIVYILWCTILYSWIMKRYKKYHRKLYDLKVEKNWFTGKRHVSADTGAITDEDEYWKNGYYYNPQDSRWWVQDEGNGTNYVVNRAHPKAKKVTIFAEAALVLFLAGLCAVFLWMDFAGYYMEISGTIVNVNAPVYHTSFELADVEEVTLLDAMPDVHYTRTNGVGTSQYLLGNFTLKDYGQCKLYVYRKYTPVLQIKLKDRYIFFNSKEEGRTEKLYGQLKTAVS